MKLALFGSMAAIALTWQASASPTASKPNSTLTSLTLETALQRAESRSPSLRSAKARQVGAEAVIDQAGVLPNPEISVEAEDIGGNGDYRGFHNSQITYGFSQQIMTWGKRGLLEKAARSDAESASFSGIGAHYELTKQVTTAFADVIAAQETVQLANETLTLAEKSSESVKRRVTASA